MSDHYTLVVKASLEIDTPGINFGKLTLHEMHGRREGEYTGTFPKYLICKNHGHMAWSGRGQQDYYPTKFIIFEVIEDPIVTEQGYRRFRCRRVIDFDLKGPSPRAQQLAKEIQEARL